MANVLASFARLRPPKPAEKAMGVKKSEGKGVRPAKKIPEKWRQGVYSEEALRAAARLGNKRKVKQLLEAGIAVNCRDELKTTPLHGAAYTGKAGVAALLLGSKANVNAVDKFGKTPLKYAMEVFEVNGPKVVELLRAAGGHE